MKAMEAVSTEALGALAVIAVEAECAAHSGTAPVGPREFWAFLRASCYWHLAKRTPGAPVGPEPPFPVELGKEIIPCVVALAAMSGVEAENRDSLHLGGVLTEIADGLTLVIRAAAADEGATVH